MDSDNSKSTVHFFSIITRLSRETIIYGVGSGLSQAISFFMLPLYTSILTPAEYGIVDIILTLNLILFIIAKLGIDSGVALIFQQKDIWHQKRMITSNLFFQIAWAVIFAGLSIFSVYLINIYLLHNDQLFVLVALSFLLLPVQGIVNYAQNIHKWKGESHRYALFSVGLTGCIVSLNVILLLFAHLKAEGIILSMLLANGLFAVIGLWSISRYLVKSFEWNDIRSCLILGAPFALSSLLIFLMPNINRFFLVEYTGLAQTGIFASALKLCIIISFATSAFDLAYSPYALSIQNTSDAKRVYAFIGRIFPLIMNIFILLLVMAAPYVIQILLGRPEYSEVNQFIGILLLATWFETIRVPCYIGLMISRQTKYIVIVSLLSLFSYVALNILLIPSFGIIGAAWSEVGIELVMTVSLFYFTQKNYYVPYKIKPFFFLGFSYLVLLFLLQMLPGISDISSILGRIAICSIFIIIAVLGSGAVELNELKSGLFTTKDLICQFIRRYTDI